MTIKTRIQPISRDIEVMIAQVLSPQARSQHLADMARQGLGDAKAVNRSVFGRETPHETFVDGAKTDNIDSVKPDGRIAFEFSLFGEVLGWIGNELVMNSPILTGQYARSHILLADGIEIEPGSVPEDAREYVFVNTVPYARKIERGLSPQAPDGVYQAIAAVAARRFGNIARISFSYRSLLEGSSSSRAERTASRQPAILVDI